MKSFVIDFLRRGITVCGLGPVILAVIYLILNNTIGLETLTVNEVCKGIFSLTLLAFTAGGMNAVYQLERLPLMAAISVHGGVLYVCYLGTYLINDWLELGRLPIMIFTGIFIFGYLLIWLIIYSFIRRTTKRLNEQLKRNELLRVTGDIKQK